MDTYQHVLFVTNCAKDDENALIQQVANLINHNNTKLSLVHIIPTIPPYFLQCPATLDLENQLKNKAQAHINRLAAKIGIKDVSTYIKSGDLEYKVEELAKQLQIDLIVMAKKPQQHLVKSFFAKLLHHTPEVKHKKIYIHSLVV